MKNIFSILCISAIITSCETTIDFEIPREKPKITIDTRIMAGDSVKALIGRTEYVLSPKNPALDQYSKVYLYEDGVKVSELRPRFLAKQQKSDSLFYYSSDYITQEGHVYKIEANRKGFNTAMGQTLIKPKVDISSVNFDKANWKLSLNIDDPKGKGDYYRISAYYKAAGREYNMYLSATDRVIQFIDGYEDDPFDDTEERGGDYGYISDEYFDGKSKRITVNINDGQSTISDTLFFEVARISEEFYLHEKSKAASEVSDGFFSEPVQIFNNIENGYGIVAGGSPNTIKLKL